MPWFEAEFSDDELKVLKDMVSILRSKPVPPNPDMNYERDWNRILNFLENECVL